MEKQGIMKIPAPFQNRGKLHNYLLPTVHREQPSKGPFTVFALKNSRHGAVERKKTQGRNGLLN